MKTLFCKLKEMKKWQKTRLGISLLLLLGIGLSFLTYSVTTLYNDKADEDAYWDSYLTTDPAIMAKVDQFGENATKVTVGTYVENLKEISLKSNYFRGEYLVWFKWQGNEDLDMMNNFRVYKGTINKKEVVKNHHEDGMNYQLVRIDVSITKNYWTPRFPLESHQLRMYIESNLPVNDVVFVKSEDSDQNPNMRLSGYNMTRLDSAVTAIEYTNNHDDPRMEGNVVTSEYMTQMELNRTDYGLYMKCFIALFGTTLWVLITLFINTYHRVDPLGMIPAALFGTVTNIMVGANLLPDALQVGLLEYVNFWGIFTILSVTFSVINVNRIRTKFEDKAFASLYGNIMFYTIIVLVLIGHILLPLSAYIS